MADNLTEERYYIEGGEYAQYETLSLPDSEEWMDGVVTNLFDDSPAGSYGGDSTISLSELPDIVLSPGADNTVFWEAPPPPAAIQSLAHQPGAWEFLTQSTYNCVSLTPTAYPYLTEDAACKLVNKLSFPRDEVYVYHTQAQIVSVQKGQRNYVCYLTPTRKEIQRKPTPIGPVVPLRKGPQRLFVLNATALYQIRMSTWEIITISVNLDDIAAITQIIQVGYQYFNNQHVDLAERNHLFIKNCTRALRQKLPAFADADIQSTMTQAIADFRQALSAARPKQSNCTIM